MKICFAIGLICLLSISAVARIAKRDDNGVPASIIQDANGNFLAINPDGSMYIIASTNSVILSILNPVTTKKMTVNQSTGTVLSVGAGATVSYTPQSNVVELFIDSIDDNTDTVRMRFYDDNVITAGTPIYIGTGKIIDTWKGIIYFQAESGTQLIIVNEIYE